MNIITISGPLGAGKDTVIEQAIAVLVKEYPEKISKALYYTTRKLRPGEVNGRDIYSCSLEDFESLKNNGQMAYSVEIQGDTPYYNGCTFKELEKSEIVLMNTTKEGAKVYKNLAEQNSGKALTVFITAPHEQRRQRIQLREGILFEEMVDYRLERDPSKETAEIASEFDVVVENSEDQVEKTVGTITAEVRKFLEQIENHAKG